MGGKKGGNKLRAATVLWIKSNATSLAVSATDRTADSGKREEVVK